MEEISFEEYQNLTERIDNYPVDAPASSGRETTRAEMIELRQSALAYKLKQEKEEKELAEMMKLPGNEKHLPEYQAIQVARAKINADAKKAATEKMLAHGRAEAERRTQEREWRAAELSEEHREKAEEHSLPYKNWQAQQIAANPEKIETYQ